METEKLLAHLDPGVHLVDLWDAAEDGLDLLLGQDGAPHLPLPLQGVFKELKGENKTRHKHNLATLEDTNTPQQPWRNTSTDFPLWLYNEAGLADKKIKKDVIAVFKWVEHSNFHLEFSVCEGPIKCVLTYFSKKTDCTEYLIKSFSHYANSLRHFR